MTSQTFKIGLLSAKSDLSRSNLLQKVRFRTKVREKRNLWEHWGCHPPNGHLSFWTERPSYMPLKLKWTCTYTTYTPTQLRTHLQSNRPDATALTLQVKCVHPGKNICALCQKFLNLSTSCSRQECDCQGIRIYAVNLPGQQCMAIWVLSNATITIQFFSGNILTNSIDTK